VATLAFTPFPQDIRQSPQGDFGFQDDSQEYNQRNSANLDAPSRDRALEVQGVGTGGKGKEDIIIGVRTATDPFLSARNAFCGE
jgi:hypothetical protein